MVCILGDVQLVQADARFMIQDGVGDDAVYVVKQALVDLFEEYVVQVAAVILLHHSFPQLG